MTRWSGQFYVSLRTNREEIRSKLRQSRTDRGEGMVKVNISLSQWIKSVVAFDRTQFILLCSADKALVERTLQQLDEVISSTILELELGLKCAGLANSKQTRDSQWHKFTSQDSVLRERMSFAGRAVCIGAKFSGRKRITRHATLLSP